MKFYPLLLVAEQLAASNSYTKVLKNGMLSSGFISHDKTVIHPTMNDFAAKQSADAQATPTSPPDITDVAVFRRCVSTDQGSEWVTFLESSRQLDDRTFLYGLARLLQAHPQPSKVCTRLALGQLARRRTENGNVCDARHPVTTALIAHARCFRDQLSLGQFLVVADSIVILGAKPGWVVDRIKKSSDSDFSSLPTKSLLAFFRAARSLNLLDTDTVNLAFDEMRGRRLHRKQGALLRDIFPRLAVERVLAYADGQLNQISEVDWQQRKCLLLKIIPRLGFPANREISPPIFADDRRMQRILKETSGLQYQFSDEEFIRLAFHLGQLHVDLPWVATRLKRISLSGAAIEKIDTQDLAAQFFCAAVCFDLEETSGAIYVRERLEKTSISPINQQCIDKTLKITGKHTSKTSSATNLQSPYSQVQAIFEASKNDIVSSPIRVFREVFDRHLDHQHPDRRVIKLATKDLLTRWRSDIYDLPHLLIIARRLCFSGIRFCEDQNAREIAYEISQAKKDIARLDTMSIATALLFCAEAQIDADPLLAEAAPAILRRKSKIAAIELPLLARAYADQNYSFDSELTACFTDLGIQRISSMTLSQSCSLAWSLAVLHPESCERYLGKFHSIFKERIDLKRLSPKDHSRLHQAEVMGQYKLAGTYREEMRRADQAYKHEYRGSAFENQILEELGLAYQDSPVQIARNEMCGGVRASFLIQLGDKAPVALKCYGIHASRRADGRLQGSQVAFKRMFWGARCRSAFLYERDFIAARDVSQFLREHLNL